MPVTYMVVLTLTLSAFIAQEFCEISSCWGLFKEVMPVLGRALFLLPGAFSYSLFEEGHELPFKLINIFSSTQVSIFLRHMAPGVLHPPAPIRVGSSLGLPPICHPETSLTHFQTPPWLHFLRFPPLWNLLLKNLRKKICTWAKLEVLSCLVLHDSLAEPMMLGGCYFPWTPEGIAPLASSCMQCCLSQADLSSTVGDF